MNAKDYYIITASLVVSFATMYGFACLGEPRSLWLMQLLGLL